jgi:hypothetical protein
VYIMNNSWPSRRCCNEIGTVSWWNVRLLLLSGLDQQAACNRPERNPLMMTPRQIEWAKQHDWYLAAMPDGASVLVKDEWMDERGKLCRSDDLVFADFCELADWARRKGALMKTFDEIAREYGSLNQRKEFQIGAQDYMDGKHDNPYRNQEGNKHTQSYRDMLAHGWDHGHAAAKRFATQQPKSVKLYSEDRAKLDNWYYVMNLLEQYRYLTFEPMYQRGLKLLASWEDKESRANKVKLIAAAHDRLVNRFELALGPRWREALEQQD